MNRGRCRYGDLEPDLANCRTTQVGAVIPGTSVDLYYCLLENDNCKYARSFGYDYVCKHTANHTFADPRDVAAGNPGR